MDSFLNESPKYLYQRRLDKYLILSENISFEGSYNNITESIYKAAQEALGIKQQQQRKMIIKLWWSDERWNPRANKYKEKAVGTYLHEMVKYKINRKQRGIQQG